MKFRFADVKSTFEPMPAGIYDLTLDTFEDKVSDNSGNHMYYCEFSPIEKEFKGRTLKTWLVYADKDNNPSPNPFALKGFLLGAGYTEDELNDDAFEFNYADGVKLIGKTFKGRIIQKLYKAKDDEGKEVERIGNTLKSFIPGKKSPSKGGNGSRIS